MTVSLPRHERISVAWTTVVVAVCWVLSIAVIPAILIGQSSAREDSFAVITVVVVALVPLSLGALLAMRSARNPAGPLLASSGFVLLATNLPSEAADGPLAGDWILLYLPFALLLLVVPGRRPTSRRWAGVGWAISAVAGLFLIAVFVQWAVPAAYDAVLPIEIALLAAFFGFLIASAASPVVRFRRADRDVRLRLRWIFLAGVSLPLTLLLCWASYLVLGVPDLVVVGLVVMYLAIPVGTTIALLRPGLLDVDGAAVATVTVGALSVGALGVLSVACGVIGVAMIDWSPPAAIGTTIALTAGVVAAFPVTHRGIGRLLYPERGRAIAAVGRLVAQVADGSARPEDIEPTLRTALRDPRLLVTYRRLTDHAMVRLDGQAFDASAEAIPVRVRGEDIGAIVPSLGRAKHPPAAVIRMAAPLIDDVRLRSELASATAEVEASRERILRAGYAERRRLERDLHDGAQQRLVALGMQLRVLQRTTSPDPVTVAALDAAVAELGTAVAELRQLAHGVRPSALDDGLEPALADLTRLAPTKIALDVQAPDLPDVVTVTAYFVVSEAVTNALRHADASQILIQVRHERGTLHVRVDDDGRGGAVMRPSGGLTGIADRVDAIGGSVSITSAADSGSTVEARIPCAS